MAAATAQQNPAHGCSNKKKQGSGSRSAVTHCLRPIFPYLQLREVGQLGRQRGEAVAVEPQALEPGQLPQLGRNRLQLVGVEPQLLQGDGVGG